MLTAERLTAAPAEPPTRAARVRKESPFRTERLPLHLETFRLRDIYLDDDGDAWIGANEPNRQIPVVNLKTGKTRMADMNLGDDQYLDMVLPMGEQIVVCGGGYRKQVFLNRKTGRRIEKPHPNPEPLIYGGTMAPPYYAYLFDTRSGIVRWDTRDCTSVHYPFPGPGKPLCNGTYLASRRAIYGVSWWQEGMPPSNPLVKFDTETGRYTIWTPPWKNVRVMQPVQVENRLYATDMFGGTLMVFDLDSERWLGRYRLPGYGKIWKYANACTVLGSWVFCNTSTFQGVKSADGTYGFDGKRHHFVNRVIAFDTRDASACLLSVPALTETGYATIAYLQALQGRVYGTCVNSTLQPDGKPNERGAAYLVSFSELT